MMDEPILQLLNHLTLRHMIWGAVACSVILVGMTFLYATIARVIVKRRVR